MAKVVAIAASGWVLFHVPGSHQELWINPEQVLTARTPREKEPAFHEGVKCVIEMSDGGYANIEETCAEFCARTTKC